ncbi:branched-chain amino acid ABC transporter permease [Bradyrhizobium sp. HKCCYLS20291]|uniref:branched-chain amino acid ABC transporter permease n=1 Tax=Bradyrhizobium sp. HKCCYLS20291 TaxID=3420766 RepID=UPI003EC12402
MTNAFVKVERWTRVSIVATGGSLLVLAALALLPFATGSAVLDKFTTLFIYVILAATWNALAGYGGLVSIGQQAFFGLGAYFTIRLSDYGVNAYLAAFASPVIVGLLAWPISWPMLRLRAGEFAIGMWVLAELFHLLVNLDPLIQGETGTSLIALNAYDASTRNALTFWTALVALAAVLAILFILLRSQVGAGLQAIRDNEEAAASIGIRVASTKQIIFVFAAAGAAIAGALWLATAISFQPKTYFSVQWTSYMIFMVLVGGLATFEGAILGAIIFFVIEASFGAAGVWYLIGLGAVALVMSLAMPRGLFGTFVATTGVRLLPIGHWLRPSASNSKLLDASASLKEDIR